MGKDGNVGKDGRLGNPGILGNLIGGNDGKDIVGNVHGDVVAIVNSQRPMMNKRSVVMNKIAMRSPKLL